MRVPEVELNVRAEESTRAPPVVANGIRVAVRDETARFVVVALVVVELPVTMRLPLIVEEAVESMPPENVRSVEVALLGNGYANVGRPRDEVEVSVYPDEEFPTRICPNVGALVRPVPP